MPSPDGRVEVVVVTRDRRASTLATLARLAALGEAPRVTVVDNASTDGTADAVTAAFPHVAVVRSPFNLGAAGRNCGVARAGAPYVAFSDDDSWWAPGALSAAADVFDAEPRLAVLAAQVLVGHAERPDPICTAMAASRVPLGQGGPGHGTPVLGFVACGSVVRRRPFLDVGGFRLGYGVGGEEELLAIDLAAAGWDLRYCPEVVAHHHPAQDRPPGDGRRRLQARNALRTAWLRRRPAGALRRSAAIARPGPTDRPTRMGVADALGDLRWIWHERAPVPAALEGALRTLEAC